MADRPIIFSGAMVRALLDGRKTQTRRLLNPQPDWLPDVTHTRNDNGPFFWPIGSLGQQCGAPLSAERIRFAVGDRAYVRESGIYYPGVPGGAGELFRHDVPVTPETGVYWSRNNGGPGAGYSVAGCSRAGALASGKAKVRPSIHMPRWASRLTLFVEDVRVQRLQDISEADAIAEGVVWQEATDADRQWAREYAAEHGSPVEIDGVWTVPGVSGGAKADVWGCTPQMAYHMLWNTLHAAPGTRWGDNPWIYALTFRVARGNIDQLETDRG